MSFGQQRGVVTPVGQQREPVRVTPGKVLSAMPVQYVAVSYGNDIGQIVQEVWLKAGENYYRAPDAEAFVTSLRTVKEGHARQVEAILKAQMAVGDDLPSTDAVDIVSKQTAAEAANARVDI